MRINVPDCRSILKHAIHRRQNGHLIAYKLRTNYTAFTVLKRKRVQLNAKGIEIGNCTSERFCRYVNRSALATNIIELIFCGLKYNNILIVRAHDIRIN